MEAQTIYEIVGYVASLLVVVSLAMSSLIRLRIVNLAGALLFAVYGALISAWPIVITNGVIAVIDVYFLWKALRDEASFGLLAVRPDSAYLRQFLDFYAGDIRMFLPDFDPGDLRNDDVVRLLLRNAVPIGVFVGRPADDGTLEVLVDYVIPEYRDFKTGRFLYRNRAERFRQAGYRQLIARGGSPRHDAYLEKMGFRRRGDRYVLATAA